jgi:hypothetical protein
MGIDPAACGEFLEQRAIDCSGGMTEAFAGLQTYPVPTPHKFRPFLCGSFG